jgi:hypothetical protein
LGLDGIVAIAPDIDSEADLSMRIVWKMQQLSDKGGNPIRGLGGTWTRT